MRLRDFQRILRQTRDAILADMQEHGFYYVCKLRHDPETWDINNGRCEEFANTVCLQAPDADWLWLEDEFEHLADCSHAVVVFGGRYYDAECIEGVDDIDDIPFVRDRGKTRAQVLAERSSPRVRKAQAAR